MTRGTVSAAGLWMFVALAAAPAIARPTHPHAKTHADHASRHVKAGTRVDVELVDGVSTKTARTGDSFALRLAAPLVVNGRLVLPIGTPGAGQVIQATRPGMGGKAAKLVLAARYLQAGDARVPLQGLQLYAAGRNNGRTASLAVRGGNVDFPAGLRAHASLAKDMLLPSLGPAPAGEAADGSGTAARAEAAQPVGAIKIPPPPAGRGQIVFFRPYAVMALGRGFKVRENRKALGKLTDGAYFVTVATPGPHVYTATFEPELKDHLRLFGSR